MATALQAFTNHKFSTIRTITSGGQVLFCDRDVAATYTNYRRSSASFISSDCVVMDIDNDHTEEPSNWITPETLGELIAGCGVPDRHIPQSPEAEGRGLGASQGKGLSVVS